MILGVGGFFKKIGSGFKAVGKGAWVGVKFAGTHSEFLEFIPLPGVAPIVKRILKSTMAVAEARGGKNKAKLAVLLALSQLRDLDLDTKVPIRKLHQIVEILLDPEITSDGYDFPDLEERAEAVKANGFEPDAEAALKMIEEMIEKGEV
jgi:hypothetical protein